MPYLLSLIAKPTFDADVDLIKFLEGPRGSKGGGGLAGGGGGVVLT